MTPTMIMCEADRHFLVSCKAVYAEGFESGYLQGEVLTDLMDSTSFALDNYDKPLADWVFLEHKVRML